MPNLLSSQAVTSRAGKRSRGKEYSSVNTYLNAIAAMGSTSGASITEFDPGRERKGRRRNGEKNSELREHDGFAVVSDGER